MKSSVRQLLFGSQFTPAKLFVADAVGAWYDRQDLSTMYQDAAGTIPAAVNQPVGKCLDKSGRGNHATQGTSASRPILRQDASGRYYLEYDGFDDGMVTAAIDFTGTAQVSLFAGITKNSEAAAGSVVETGAAPITTNGTFGLLAPASAASTSYFARVYHTTDNGRSTTSFPAPVSNVITVAMDLSTSVQASQLSVRVNGVAVGLSGGVAASTGVFANQPMYIGRRGGASNPFNGRDYGLIVLGRTATATEIARTERWLASRTGVAL